MKITNAVKCKRCGDIIYSRARHDFRYCSCKNIAIDGGFDYVRIIGFQNDWEKVKPFEIPVDVMGLYLDYTTQENKYGVIKTGV